MNRPRLPDSLFWSSEYGSFVYSTDQMHAYYDSRPLDCRTCKRFYDWEDKVCTQSNKNPCTDGDRYTPLPVVQLWRVD